MIKVSDSIILDQPPADVYVHELETGLPFYRDRLGHEVIWRTELAVGLRLPETDEEASYDYFSITRQAATGRSH